jgi:hypothetical protein
MSVTGWLILRHKQSTSNKHGPHCHGMWASSDAKEWQVALDGYAAAAESHEELDTFWREAYPAAVRARAPHHITKDELLKGDHLK